MSAGSVLLQPAVLLSKCRWKRNVPKEEECAQGSGMCPGKWDAYKSGAALSDVTFHRICLLIGCHLFRYACLYNATLSRMHAGQASFIQICLLVPSCKTCLSGHSKIDKTKILMTNGSLVTVKSIAECSPWSILQYF